MTRRIFPFFFSLIALLLYCSRAVFASGEFQIDTQTIYRVGEDRRINVHQKISLTNKMANVYAEKYTIEIESLRMENFRASDSQGPISVKLSTDEKKTKIDLTFNDQSVGKGKTMVFEIEYDALDLVQKNGQAWEITIPKVSKPENIENFDFQLFVPKGLGQAAFISPKPIAEEQLGNFNLYKFSKNQLSGSGTKLIFGEFQVFDFNINYHLENKSRSEEKQQIALPPDTSFQQVAYAKITPEPEGIEVDPDGNWLASYILEPNEKINISVEGYSRLFPSPRSNFPLPTSENLKNNLRSQPYWETQAAKIKAAAKHLRSAKTINQYVANTLSYNFDRIGVNAKRLGALTALNNPDLALCMEFSDLFVAIARAADIPAREIEGYAYTANEKIRPIGLIADVLHAWPEYWNEARQIWLPLDPTWENTTGGIDHFEKMDLNHFVFVIHGENSILPAAPGAYKASGASGKDIEVKFGGFHPLEESRLYPSFITKRFFPFSNKISGRLVIKNQGTIGEYNIPTEIVVENGYFSGDNLTGESIKKHIAVIPPYGSETIDLEIKKSFWSIGRKSVLKILVNEKESVIPVNFESTLLIPLAILFSALIFGLTISFRYLLTKKTQ